MEKKMETTTFMAIVMCLGLLFYTLVGFRYPDLRLGV